MNAIFLREQLEDEDALIVRSLLSYRRAEPSSQGATSIPLSTRLRPPPPRPLRLVMSILSLILPCEKLLSIERTRVDAAVLERRYREER